MKHISDSAILAGIIFFAGVLWSIFTMPDRRLVSHWWRKRHDGRVIPVTQIFMAFSPLAIWAAAIAVYFWMGH